MQAEGFRELLKCAQASDRCAMNAVLSIVREHLEKTARRAIDSDEAVERTSDLVQEASLRVWQNIGQFRGGAETDEQALAMFLAWSGQIVRRVSLNAQRERNTQRRRPTRRTVSLDASSADFGSPASNLPGVEPTPSKSLGARERERAVLAALDRLPEQLDRIVLELRFFEGASLRQIAEQLQLSYDKVRERYRTAMVRLEHDLGRLL